MDAFNQKRDAQFPQSQHDQITAPHDEIDLRELFKVLWRGKWLIAAITSVFVIGSVIYALSLPNIYKSEALLAPAHSESGGSLGALAGQFGGLASLAGIDLGRGGKTDKTVLAIEVMKSRAFIGEFIKRYDLLVPLMASKDWDSQTNQLIIDNDVYDETTENWVREVKPPRQSRPSLLEAHQVFLEEVLNVTTEKDTGLVTISISHYSPFIAKQWLDWLVNSINIEMKKKDLAEAQRSINYLNEQLKQTRITNMRSVFYQLIEEQTKTIMLSEVRDEYVLKTVDGAIVPELNDKPKRALICVLGMLFGMTLSMLVVLIRHFSKVKEKNNEVSQIEAETGK